MSCNTYFLKEKKKLEVSKVHCFAGINSTCLCLCMLFIYLFMNIWALLDFNFEYINIIYTGGSKLESGWSQDHPSLEKKKSLLYIKFKNLMIFLP